jgi:hypothetical protein
MRVVLAPEAPCKAEVANLKITVHVDQDVGGLEVAMHYVGRVKIEDTSEQLVHEVLIVVVT